jgi:hypothetical protein
MIVRVEVEHELNRDFKSATRIHLHSAMLSGLSNLFLSPSKSSFCIDFVRNSCKKTVSSRHRVGKTILFWFFSTPYRNLFNLRRQPMLGLWLQAQTRSCGRLPSVGGLGQPSPGVPTQHFLRKKSDVYWIRSSVSMKT